MFFESFKDEKNSEEYSDFSCFYVWSLSLKRIIAGKAIVQENKSKFRDKNVNINKNIFFFFYLKLESKMSQQIKNADVITDEIH